MVNNLQFFLMVSPLLLLKKNVTGIYVLQMLLHQWTSNKNKCASKPTQHVKWLVLTSPVARRAPKTRARISPRRSEVLFKMTFGRYFSKCTVKFWCKSSADWQISFNIQEPMSPTLLYIYSSTRNLTFRPDLLLTCHLISFFSSYSYFKSVYLRKLLKSSIRMISWMRWSGERLSTE